MATGNHYVGASGEYLVAAFFLKQGIGVYFPSHLGKKDMVVFLGTELGYYGVQVKTQSKPLPEKRRNKRYRYGFNKPDDWYNSYDLPIFCCVALDKMLIQFFLNDGKKQHYLLHEITFTKQQEQKSFDAVMKQLNYYG